MGGFDQLEGSTMTNEEKAIALSAMPDDFRPKAEADFFALYFEYQRGFDRLTDDQAGKVVKRLFAYAQDYGRSYDASLQPDFDGLDAGAEMLLEMVAASVKRVYDVRRETAFLRSGNNKGGRPAKT